LKSGDAPPYGQRNRANKDTRNTNNKASRQPNTRIKYHNINKRPNLIDAAASAAPLPPTIYSIDYIARLPRSQHVFSSSLGLTLATKKKRKQIPESAPLVLFLHMYSVHNTRRSKMISYSRIEALGKHVAVCLAIGINPLSNYVPYL